MNHCYRCGKPLQDGEKHVRRKVKTGEWVRKDYRKKGVLSVQNHFGLRIVCRRCAWLLDIQGERQDAIANAKVALALAVLIAVLLAGIF